ncbi:DUF262 domain-containing protein, partial [bacterium]|nr:DUF262 domain-containing protein [bacterium]
MQVSHLPIYQFIEGSNKVFIIPVYQRDYSWKINNCEKLWIDLKVLKEKKDHFIGTIVTISDNFEKYSIIDGQQRLTTISLLLIALLNYLKKLENKENFEINLQQQIEIFLINKYSHEDLNRIRLKPNKNDKIYFEKLIDNKDNYN